jgi:hypothetical protein
MRSSALALLVIATAAVLTVAGPASASPWRTDPEADASALARLGVRVDWPLHEKSTTLAAGATLTIGVRSTRGTAVEVTFLRVTARGSVMRRLADRRLRDGRVTVRVPAGAGRAYQLWLSAGSLRFRGAITAADAATPSVASPAPTVVPVPVPVPAPVIDSGGDPPPPPHDPGPWCSLDGLEAAEVRLVDPDRTFAPGDAVDYTLANTGERCLSYSAVVVWERQGDDGTWTIWPTHEIYPSYLGEDLYPGVVQHDQTNAPSDATPGRYRFLRLVSPHGGPGWSLDNYDLTPGAELNIVAPDPS